MARITVKVGEVRPRPDTGPSARCEALYLVPERCGLTNRPYPGAEPFAVLFLCRGPPVGWHRMGIVVDLERQARVARADELRRHPLSISPCMAFETFIAAFEQVLRILHPDGRRLSQVKTRHLMREQTCFGCASA